MVSELRIRNQAQRLYVQALSTAWRNQTQLWDPSIWLARDPDIEEKMLRDADIAHAVDFRRHLIAGQRWAMQPRAETERAPMAVQIATALVDNIKHFAEARLCLARAFFSGARFGRIHGRSATLTIGDGKPRTWWVPHRIEDLDKRMFRIVPHTDNDGIVSAHWERWDVGRSDFFPESVEDSHRTIRHLYQDDQGTLSHGRALREALGWVWYAKTNAATEAMQAVERHAQGILTAKVSGVRNAATGLPNSELIEAWQEALENLRSRHVMVFDADDTVEVIEPSGTGWQLVQEMLKDYRSQVNTLVLGANLTTSANEGGSYALAAIQENSTEALVQYDRQSLEETLTDDLVGCLWHFNRRNLVELGIADQPPLFSITQEKRQDPMERASVAQILNAMGVELPTDDVLDQTGFRNPEPGEQIIPKAAPPAANGFPSMGGDLFSRMHMADGPEHAPSGSPEGGRFLPKGEGGGGESEANPKDDAADHPEKRDAAVQQARDTGDAALSGVIDTMSTEVEGSQKEAAEIVGAAENAANRASGGGDDGAAEQAYSRLETQVASAVDRFEQNAGDVVSNLEDGLEELTYQVEDAETVGDLDKSLAGVEKKAARLASRAETKIAKHRQAFSDKLGKAKQSFDATIGAVT
jgi:hypothetical protein